MKIHLTHSCLAAAVLLAACNGKEAVRPGTDEPVRRSDTLVVVPRDSTAEALDWNRDPVIAQLQPRAIAIVRDIRVGRHDGFDRIVVEFEEGIMPEYHVAYSAEQPTQCGSGFPLEMAGEAVLEIRLEPARGFTEEGRATVDHAARSYDFKALREAKISCDYEAVFTILLALQSDSGFRVTTMEGPTRLIIDVRHPEN